MTLKKHFLNLIMIGLVFSLRAQQQGLFIPTEIREAIETGTRTTTGKPGDKYWQNYSTYEITADFDPRTGKIAGTETIRYKNNSPKNIYMLLLNLYPNLFKKGGMRDREVATEDVHNGMVLKKVKINENQIATHAISYNGTGAQISLPKLLLPKNEMKIEIEWEFTMQGKTTIRVGKYGENTWFVGYWYPQVAVFDDVFGWDDVDYDGLHEFYSAYADFDVKLNVPETQLVWATGTLENPDEILNPVFFDRYKAALQSEKKVSIVGINDLKTKITRPGPKCWHFKASNVTDFSFATAANYLWDGLTIKTDVKNNKETFLQVAYHQNSLDFFEVAEIGRKTIKYLSDTMPGVPFPYPRMTVFNGGGGMEFPMMVNDRSESSYSATVDLTSHEISHTYFPFFVGINQEKYSWMDEGWAQFIPALFQEHEVKLNDKRAESVSNYTMYAGNGLEMPMMVPSFYMKGYEYFIASYYRPQVALMVLEDLLGKEVFLKALKEYIERWNGKFPTPYDFFFTFNDVSGKDLTWFWKPWYFETGYPDLAIGEVQKTAEGYDIEIRKNGNLPVPVDLKIEYVDSGAERIYKTAEIWKEMNNSSRIKLETKRKVKRLALGNEFIPDINMKDNRKIMP